MAEKIVGVYDIKVDKAISQLNELSKRVDKIDKSAAKSAKKTEDAYSGMASKLSSQFKSLAGTIGLAFGTQQIVSFGQEAVRVAAQAEGISKAFERLNRPNLLAELRKATRGTVSDLKLMQQAVRANNFQVPLEKLGSFFEFATKRSIETGESVDYLVQSIVDGIGRKSTLVLDNLGISASELQDEIKRTGDFGEAAANIIERSLAQTGDVADTTAIRIAQLNTVLENTKVLIGEGLISAAEGSASALTPLLNILEKISETTSEEASKEGILESIKNATSALVKSQSSLLLFANIIDKIAESFSDTEEEVQKTKRGVVGLADVLKSVFGKEQEQIRSISLLSSELKDLKNEFNELEIGSDAWNQKVVEISQKTSELAAATTKATAQLVMFQQAARGFDPFAVQQEEPDLDFKAIDEETEAIREAVNEQVFIREDGSERIQNIIDEQLRATLEGLDDEEKARKKIEEQKEKYHQLELRRKEEERRFGLQIVQETANLVAVIGELQQKSVQHDLNALDKLYSQGKINREQYEKEERDIKIKAAKQAKALAIFQAVVNTAVGITQALSSAPPPYSYVLAGISGALGAVQIGVAAAEPLPQFAEGGFVNEHGQLIGRKHSQGGITIEAEGGEFITSAKHAQQNADILKAINSGEWEKYKVENIIAPAINQVLEGGFQGMGASYMLNTNWTDKNLLKQGDRNRYAMRDGFVYLGDRMEKTLRRQKFDRYA